MTAAPIIAKCTRCGRGFVYVNESRKLVDRYPADGRAECGGDIRFLVEPVPNEIGWQGTEAATRFRA